MNFWSTIFQSHHLSVELVSVKRRNVLNIVFFFFMCYDCQWDRQLSHLQIKNLIVKILVQIQTCRYILLHTHNTINKHCSTRNQFPMFFLLYVVLLPMKQTALSQAKSLNCWNCLHTAEVCLTRILYDSVVNCFEIKDCVLSAMNIASKEIFKI